MGKYFIYLCFLLFAAACQPKPEGILTAAEIIDFESIEHQCGRRCTQLSRDRLRFAWANSHEDTTTITMQFVKSSCHYYTGQLVHKGDSIILQVIQGGELCYCYSCYVVKCKIINRQDRPLKARLVSKRKVEYDEWELPILPPSPDKEIKDKLLYRPHRFAVPHQEEKICMMDYD